MGELTEYVKKELEKGFAKDDVEAVLVKAGYKPEDIKEAFTQITITPAVADRPKKVQFLDRRYIVFSALSIAVLFIGVLLMLWAFKDSDDAKIPVVTQPIEPIELSEEYLDCTYPIRADLAACQGWATGNNSHCEGLLEGDQLLCDTLVLAKLAWQKNDRTVCNVDGKAKYGCLAFVEGNPSVCPGLENDTWIDVCNILARAKKIVDSADKASCQALGSDSKSLCEGMIQDNLELCSQRFNDAPCAHLK
jgi:hypothetical protein